MLKGYDQLLLSLLTFTQVLLFSQMYVGFTNFCKINWDSFFEKRRTNLSSKWRYIWTVHYFDILNHSSSFASNGPKTCSDVKCISIISGKQLCVSITNIINNVLIMKRNTILLRRYLCKTRRRANLLRNMLEEDEHRVVSRATSCCGSFVVV